MHEQITVEVVVGASIEKVWDYWNDPAHMVVWDTGSPLWHTPAATNDLVVGGVFDVRMEARDGSAGFNFRGTYTCIEPSKRIEYTIEDGRKVVVTFEGREDGVLVREVFESEEENSIELQREGWQGILNNFKKYIEQ